MTKIATSIFLTVTALGQAADQASHQSSEAVSAVRLSTGSRTNITCKSAYYRRAQDGQLIPVADAQLMKCLSVDGIVLSIVEPEHFKGKVVALHFDFPESWDNWYLPDFLYRGQVYTRDIGSLAFMCDPGYFVPVTDPLPSSRPEALKQLLRHRTWSNRFAAAIKEQFGDKVLFEALYSFLTDTNRSPGTYADQKTAAGLLVRFQPACGVAVERAISQTLSTWDESVREWPLYLWRAFGRDKQLHVLEDLQAGELSETDRDATDIWRSWLSGDEKDLSETQ